MACSPFLGMNYGHQFLSGKIPNEVEVDNDLNWLWNHGIRKLRIAGGDLGNTDITSFLDSYPDLTGATAGQQFTVTRFYYLLQVAQWAKTRGFYVVFPVTGTSGLNDTTWSIYTANVNKAADILWNSGTPQVDEFQIGNELELITSGPSSLQAKINTMATDVKTNHFISDGLTTFISYGHAQGNSSAWISVGSVNYDLVEHHAYNSGSGDYEKEINNLIATFGKDKITIGEWNVNSTWPFTRSGNINTCEDVNEECSQIYTRFKKLKKLAIPTYFFTYRWDQNSDSFSLWDSSNGKHRDWYSVLFDRYRIENSDDRRKITTAHGYAHDSSNAARRCRRSGALTGILTTSAYTLSIWVKPNVFSGAPRIIQTAGTGSFNVQLTGSRVLFSLSTSAGAKISSLSTDDLNLRLGEWNHLLWRDNGGVATWYVNAVRGLRNYNYTQSGTFEATLTSIGIEPVNNFNNFNGQIDELAIYPFALSYGQIRRLYEQGNSNLVGYDKSLYLKFDEGTGTVVSDSSGNGQDFALESASGAWVARNAEAVARSQTNNRTQTV